MTLTWPWALTALAALLLLPAYRWWANRRRRRATVRLPSVALVRAALPGRSTRRRRVPVWLFTAGLVVLTAGVARPHADLPVPADATTILLAVDVSASMCSTDVAPNRLTAAQKAAREFIRAQDDDVRIGLVTFAGTAGLLVPPTTVKKDLLSAVDGLRTSRGTAIGLAILASIDAIADGNPDVPPTGVDVPAAGRGRAGGFRPDAIVVLTDGRNTHGVEPLTAADEAAARRLRVYPIGFGTDRPSPMVCPREQVSGDPSGGDGQGFPGGFGGGRFQQIDDGTLREVADRTGGEYFEAADAGSLTEVLLELPGQILVQRRPVEITMWFALVGALLVLAGVALSQWWNRTVRLPSGREADSGPSRPPAGRLNRRRCPSVEGR